MTRLKFAMCSLLVLYLSGIALGQGQEQKKLIAPSVLVDIGQPNIWTLEQAHYLLERNRSRDLGIAAKDVGDLDPNETVGFRLDVLKTLFSGQIQFDQTTGVKNQVALQQFKVDTDRFNRLRARLDDLRGQQTDLGSQLATATQDLMDLKEKQKQATDPKLDLQVAEAQDKVTALTARKGAVDSEASALTSQVATPPALQFSSTLPSGTGGSASVIGNTDLLDKLLKNVPDGVNQSKLAASIRLDNFINLQYEIVAKQLTLLRDEAGPNNRVIFMELPQDIYATQKFKPYPDLPALWGHHLVQTWWRISRLVTAESCAESGECPAKDQEFRAPDLSDICQLWKSDILTKIQQREDAAYHPGLTICPVELGTERFTTINDPCAQDGCHQAPQTPQDHSLAGLKWDWLHRWKIADVVFDNNEKEKPPRSATSNMPYVLELIPRQGALNVSDAHSTSRAFGFSGLFGFLTGLGGGARFERQHDEFSQFTQQEVFASAFGKGAQTFGWTFGPLPGTKRLAPGLRTTYAVLVVPKSTRAIQLEAYGCSYRRRTVPKNPFTYPGAGEDCEPERMFMVQIPRGGDSFYVEEIFYKSTPVGQRATVEIDGIFSHDAGVLINGTPLQKVVSIGQPLPGQESFKVPDNAGDRSVQGVFELVGSKRLILSFVMPSTFNGTPEIALTSSSKAAVINEFRLRVNDKDTTLNDSPDPIFYQPLQIVRMSPALNDNVVTLDIFGQGFNREGDPIARTFVLNDQQLSQAKSDELKPGEYRVINETLIKAKFDRPKNQPHWHVTFIQHLKNGAVESHNDMDDTLPPVVDSSNPCEFGKPKPNSDGNIVSIPVTIRGKFFTPVFTPTLLDPDRKFTITSVALKAPDEWNLSLVGPVSDSKNALRSLVVRLKGPGDSVDVSLSKCSGAPPSSIRPGRHR
ncbi:MAG TPA: hypothetical protein VG759_19880 [Candidatus Angelobacter sp.]|jgi:hypothetical protein|nr:hypothetical protein [Candidatus Angelobacter sp.]